MSLLSRLSETGRIWSAKQWQVAQVEAIATEFPVLDQYLPGGGWPVSSVTEILYQQSGIGELRLLLPALARISQQDQRWQLWLNAPLQPCAPSLQQWQIDTERLLIAHARHLNDFCYCIEKSLNSGGCQGVVAWCGKLEKALMRRIQLATERAKAPVFLLRPATFIDHPSIAALRLHLCSESCIHILKRRAGWRVDNLKIDIPLFHH